MGIGNKDHVVVYDTRGIFSSCRVYWTFKVTRGSRTVSFFFAPPNTNPLRLLQVFGHDKVSILSGGLPDWLAENNPTALGPVDPVVSTLYYYYVLYLMKKGKLRCFPSLTRRLLSPTRPSSILSLSGPMNKSSRILSSDLEELARLWWMLVQKEGQSHNPPESKNISKTT